MGKLLTHQPLTSQGNIDRIRRIVDYDYDGEMDNYCDWVEENYNDPEHANKVMMEGARPIYKGHIFYDLYYLRITLNNQK